MDIRPLQRLWHYANLLDKLKALASEKLDNYKEIAKLTFTLLLLNIMLVKVAANQGA
jgi:hypothetical protein